MIYAHRNSPRTLDRMNINKPSNYQGLKQTPKWRWALYTLIFTAIVVFMGLKLNDKSVFIIGPAGAVIVIAIYLGLHKLYQVPSRRNQALRNLEKNIPLSDAENGINQFEAQTLATEYLAPKATNLPIQKKEKIAVTIHCPICGAKNTNAQAWALIVNTFVVCGSCQKKSLSKVDVHTLAELSPDCSAPLLVPYMLGVGKFLSVLAAIFMIWPGGGFIFATIALLANRNSLGWPRKLSKIVFNISLVLTSIAVALGIVAIIMSDNQ